MRAEITVDGVSIEVDSNGTIFRRNHIYKPQTDANGYRSINIGKKRYLIHRLVAMAFLKDYSENMQVHHINADRSDNQLCNLKCMTAKEHQYLHKQIYPEKKECVVCGKIFTPAPTKRKRNKVCSNECKLILDKINAQKRKRKICQFSKSGEFIKMWDSARDIQNNTGFCESNINKCCNHLIKSYKGYIWEYAKANFMP